MPEQIAINFELHARENSYANEAILNAQRKRLDNNCKVLLNALLEGKRLNPDNIWEQYRIREYRRRFKSLRDAGIRISEDILKNGCKEKYMTESDIKHFKENFDFLVNELNN